MWQAAGAHGKPEAAPESAQGDVVPLRRLRADVHAAREPRDSHEDPFGRAAVQLHGLRQELRQEGDAGAARPQPHGREAVRLRVLRPQLHGEGEPDGPFTDAHGREAVQLLPLQPQVQPAVQLLQAPVSKERPDVCPHQCRLTAATRDGLPPMPPHETEQNNKKDKLLRPDVVVF